MADGHTHTPLSFGAGRVSLLTANVYVIGFVGVGKSTVGSALAAEMDVPFTDMDEMVEEESGLSVEEIFRVFGEPVFRHRERVSLEEVARRAGAVVALGSGTACSVEAWGLVRASGLSVWLECPFHEMVGRLRRSHAPRPVSGGEEVVRGLYLSREPWYAMADLKVPTGQKSVRAVVRDVLQWLRMKGAWVDVADR